MITGLKARLVSPCLEHATTFIEGIRETYPGNSVYEKWLKEIEGDFGAHLAKLEKRKLGDEKTEGIPQHTYWLLEDDRYLGHVNVRTELNDKLRRMGGHIGYEIRPTERGRGLGSLMLKFALDKAREFGLKKVLITCDTVNKGSIGVIENNGGKNPEHAQIEEWPSPIFRYWIDI